MQLAQGAPQRIPLSEVHHDRLASGSACSRLQLRSTAVLLRAPARYAGARRAFHQQKVYSQAPPGGASLAGMKKEQFGESGDGTSIERR
jgi:hypothetical protein